MNAQCPYHDEIADLLFAPELDSTRREELAAHLEECQSCREEFGELEKAIHHLKSYPPLPPPRHFFVYEEPKTRWMGLGSGFWRGALAASVLLFLLAAGAIGAGLEVHRDQGSLTLAFGPTTPDPRVLVQELRNDLVAEIETRLQQEQGIWLDQVRAEIEQNENELDRRQKQSLNEALSRVEGRLQDEFEARLLNLDADLRQSSLDLAHLAEQNRRAFEILNGRIDLISVRDEIQGSRNQVLVSTLLEIADRQLIETATRE